MSIGLGAGVMGIICGPLITDCNYNLFVDPSLSNAERETIVGNLMDGVDRDLVAGASAHVVH